MSERISLKNELFAEAIDSADTALALLIRKMQHRGATEGKLTLSIAIELTPEDIIDQNGRPQEIQRPSIKYKAGYAVPDKESISGEIRNDRAAIVNAGQYPSIADIGDEQMSLL